MVFSSLTFLCIFLPVVLAPYYLLPTLRIRNILLIAVSLLFYAYGEPVYVLLMIASIIISYIFGRLLGTENKKKRQWILAIAVVINIGLLVVFKYLDMMVQTVNQLCGSEIPLVGLALPIGISFFTFQALSYVIDVYRREVEPQKNLWNVMLYISFFPQLIAGPIVKYHDIQEQIDNRNTDVKEIAEGLRRFIIGLSKKVLISNTVGQVAIIFLRRRHHPLMVLQHGLRQSATFYRFIMISVVTVIWPLALDRYSVFIFVRTSTIHTMQHAFVTSGESGIFPYLPGSRIMYIFH